LTNLVKQFVCILFIQTIIFFDFYNILLNLKFLSLERKKLHQLGTTFLSYLASAFFAVSTIFANAALSVAAMSARTFLLSSMLALFKPLMNML